MLRPPPLVKSILEERCPNCRKGAMFSQKSVFPIKGIFKMPDCCAECNQRMELEPGFFYGSSYVSYGLGIAVTILVLVIYALIFGLSIINDSIYYSLGIALLALILLMPWILRYSRVIYFYFFVNYGSNKHSCASEPEHSIS